MPVLRVIADNLGPGSLPVYSVPKDWPFPVLSVSKDGDTLLRLTPSGERVYLETFEISGTKERIRERVAEVLTGLVLTAGFAGRATIAVRSDYVLSTEDGPLSVLEVAMMFTADWDEEPGPGVVQWSAPESWRPDGFPELDDAADDLLDGFTVMDVMLS